jgi:hypothetical protein
MWTNSRVRARQLRIQPEPLKLAGQQGAPRSIAASLWIAWTSKSLSLSRVPTTLNAKLGLLSG